MIGSPWKVVRTLALCVVFAGLGQSLSAEIAVSNLDETHGTYDRHGVSSSQWLAGGFTTGADAATLDAVSLWLRGSNSAGNGFAVSIYSDDGTMRPGSLLSDGMLAGSAHPTGDSLFTYTGDVSLEANTRYWVVASVASNDYGTYGWYYTWSNAETSPIGWTIANLSAFTNSSGTWATANGIVQFGVNTVPEPGTLVSVLTLAIAGVLASVRLQRR